MQVLCKSTSHSPDMCCPVCGQGFVLFSDRQSKIERAYVLREVTLALRSHHLRLPGIAAHPQRGFLVSHSSGSVAISDTPMLGNAPRWAL